MITYLLPTPLLNVFDLITLVNFWDSENSFQFKRSCCYQREGPINDQAIGYICL